MSFSQQVKKEIISRDLPKSCCAVAAAYAVACFGKYFDTRGIVLHTEQLSIAQYAKKLLDRVGVFGTVTVKGKEDGSLYEFAVKEKAEVAKMLALFDYCDTDTNLRINSAHFKCEHCVTAFVSTAFLCCGTMTDPKQEYNLEFLSARYHLMKDFEALLMSRDFSPRHTQRKGANVLYLKASEQIEDLLTFMGASGAALEIMNLKVYKDFRNKANRITNCETANIDKTVAANSATLQAILLLKKKNAFDALPEMLQNVANLRTENPDLSLKDLAQLWSPPLSKSGLSHRLKKIEQSANAMMERANNA
ncbi:MAG: DNA-binding protein WhiA [Ruthenibacterium sp.]